jgi:hypothetical protein
MSGRKPIGGSLEKVHGIDGHFVPRTLDMLMSDAFRTLPINGHRLLAFLEAEHLRHGRMCNGALMATYDQLVDWGIGRRLVHDTITECEKRGLIEVIRAGRRGFTETATSRYRLTYLPARVGNASTGYWTRATDEWRQYQKPTSKNAKHRYEGELRQFTKVNFDSSRRGTPSVQETAEIRHSPTVHEGEPLIDISEGIEDQPASPAAALASDDQPQSIDQPEEHSSGDTPGRASVDTLAPPPVVAAVSEPHQIDLEEFIAASLSAEKPAPTNSGPASRCVPADVVRERIKAEGIKIGELAKALGVAGPTMSNRLSPRHAERPSKFSLNATAEAALAAWVAGRPLPGMGAVH